MCWSQNICYFLRLFEKRDNFSLIAFRFVLMYGTTYSSNRQSKFYFNWQINIPKSPNPQRHITVYGNHLKIKLEDTVPVQAWYLTSCLPVFYLSPLFFYWYKELLIKISQLFCTTSAVNSHWCQCGSGSRILGLCGSGSRVLNFSYKFYSRNKYYFLKTENCNFFYP